MEIKSQIIIAITSYKIISLFVGLIFTYMGYRLFMAGVWGEAGDVEAKFKDTKVIIKRAAPGTFFALFGTIIVCFVVFKELRFEDKGSSTTTQQNVIEIIEDNNEIPDVLPF